VKLCEILHYKDFSRIIKVVLPSKINCTNNDYSKVWRNLSR
jgi:hypothetical protein